MVAALLEVAMGARNRRSADWDDVVTANAQLDAALANLDAALGETA